MKGRSSRFLSQADVINNKSSQQRPRFLNEWLQVMDLQAFHYTSRFPLPVSCQLLFSPLFLFTCIVFLQFCCCACSIPGCWHYTIFRSFYRTPAGFRSRWGLVNPGRPLCRRNTLYPTNQKPAATAVTLPSAALLASGNHESVRGAQRTDTRSRGFHICS